MPFYLFNTPSGIVRHVCTMNGYIRDAAATHLQVVGIAGPCPYFCDFAKHVTSAVMRSWTELCMDAGVRASFGTGGSFLHFSLPLTGVDTRSAHNQFQFWRQIVEHPKVAAKVARLWERIGPYQKEDRRERVAKALWAYYFGGKGHSIVAACPTKPRELVQFLEEPMHRRGEFHWHRWNSRSPGLAPTEKQLLICELMGPPGVGSWGVTLGEWMRVMAPGTVLRPKRNQAKLEDWL